MGLLAGVAIIGWIPAELYLWAWRLIWRLGREQHGRIV
jgi:hypothetical protein